MVEHTLPKEDCTESGITRARSQVSLPRRFGGPFKNLNSTAREITFRAESGERMEKTKNMIEKWELEKQKAVTIKHCTIYLQLLGFTYKMVNFVMRDLCYLTIDFNDFLFTTGQT